METSEDRKKIPDVMIVDDEPANLQVLSGILKQNGYHVRPASTGRQALEGARLEPPDLILLDINMPDMNGYEVCETLKSDRILWHIPVIFISALSDTADIIKAFSSGGVDYVTKPFQYEEVRARVDTHIKMRFLQKDLEDYNTKLEVLVLSQVKEISESQMATIFALAELSESRDEDTGKHLERVRMYCKILCDELATFPKFERIITPEFSRELSLASPLHDIGKVAIPDAVLLKPGKLTVEEFELMKKHTVLGSETLQKVRTKYPNNTFVNMGIDISRSHHEKWDGTGYPDGLKGEKIPISARIMTVADVYDALRSKRCYKPAMPHEESVDCIVKAGGTQFDPDIIKAFKNVHEKFRVTADTVHD